MKNRQLYLRSIGVSLAWGIAVVIAVMFISGIVAMSLPSEVRTGSNVALPGVGKVYSKEEMDRNERLAKEDLEKARRDFAKEGLAGQIRSGWMRSLPYIAFVALGVVLVAARRAKPLAVVAAALPTLALLLVVQINLIFPVLATLTLIGFLTWRRKWPNGAMK